MSDDRIQNSTEKLAREAGAAATGSASRQAHRGTLEQVAQAGRPVSFYPTVKTALLAGTAVLEVLCPACQTIGQVDLRDLDVHGRTSLSTVIRRLSCRRCCPNPPFAKPVGLRRGPARWFDPQSAISVYEPLRPVRVYFR
jgi:hypothetical protein